MDLFDTADFGDHVDKLLGEWHVPGIAIAVVQDDKISSRGYGKACLDPETPVTADTLFDIASCSKSLTAGAVSLLVEDDERYPAVKWDAKMSALLPEDFVMADDYYTKGVTVEDILSHRTGLPSHDISYKHGDTPRSVTRNLRNLEITEPIRTKEQYCNMMFTIATHLVETCSEQSFPEFLTEHFLKPLGMKSTYIQPDTAIADGQKYRIFTPYHWDQDEQRYHPAKLQQIPEAQGAGSVFTCVNDYILWVKAMMNQEGPVTQGLYNGLVKPRIITNPDDGPDDLEPLTSPSMYAAGLEVKYYRGHKIVSHSGGDPGIGSFHFFLPGKKFGGVLMGNSWLAGEVAATLSHELIDEVLGVPKNERPDWNALQHKEDDEYNSSMDDGWKEALGIGKDNEIPEFDPQSRPLEDYTGKYHNAGYHDMVVEIKDGQLYVDASDRTMGFYLTLEHFKDQDKYLGHIEEYYDGRRAETGVKFRFEGEKAVRFGVDLEDATGDLIWFDRVNELVSR